MTGIPSIFSSMTESNVLPHVTVANGSTTNVRGIGTIVLSPNIALSSCLYVPSVSFNLISVSKLIKDLNCTITFSSSSVLIQDMKTQTTIGGGHERRGLYYQDVPVSSTSCSALVDPLHVHCRLGHPSLDKLKSMFPSLC